MSDIWDGPLGEGEEILWQGAPTSKVRIEWQSPLVPVVLLALTGYSVYFMIDASQYPGFFWAFGLVLFAVGIHGLISVHFFNAYIRRRQHYTLTNRRAVISTKIFGLKSLQSYSINHATEVTFQDAGATGDIYFAKHENRLNNRTYTTRIGFEQIEGAQEVLSLMRQAQRGSNRDANEERTSNLATNRPALS